MLRRSAVPPRTARRAPRLLGLLSPQQRYGPSVSQLSGAARGHQLRRLRSDGAAPAGGAGRAARSEPRRPSSGRAPAVRGGLPQTRGRGAAGRPGAVGDLEGGRRATSAPAAPASRATHSGTQRSSGWGAASPLQQGLCLPPISGVPAQPRVSDGPLGGRGLGPGFDQPLCLLEPLKTERDKKQLCCSCGA